jgi:iron(III) transport system substrate-binding protein
MIPKVTIKLLVFFLLIGCSFNSSDSPILTVYVSADEQIAREIFSAFTKKTGIKVEWVGDTESSKTTALVQRLIREKKNPVADVFWSSEILGTMQLADAGVLAASNSSACLAWPKQYRDVDFKWFAFSPRARVIAYNPLKIEKDSLPKTWWEYGAASMADPRFGTTGTHVAVMAKLFPDEFFKFLTSMQGTVLLGGNAATVQSVVDGTALFAMTDSDDVHSAIARGHSIAMHFPIHKDGEGGGTLLIPNTVGVVNNCRYPGLAMVFIDFMLSDEVATLLASSSSKNIPIQPSVAEFFPELLVENPLEVSFLVSAAKRKDAINLVMEAHSSEDQK